MRCAGDGGSIGWLAVVQCRQPDARARTLNACDYDPQPAIHGQGVLGIRGRRAQDAFAILRAGGQRHGEAGEVRTANVWLRGLLGKPL